MDFITDFALSKVDDQLWVMVDKYSKMAYFIPFRKINKKALDLAERS
jgi:hypothetical protein